MDDSCFDLLKNELEHISKGLEDGFFKLLSSKLDKKEFNLVVIGQFKRGKSTFINALLKEELLPSAVVPLTSIVTIIQYGDDPKIIIEYKNHSKSKDNIDNINLYVTEKHNPHNKLNVEQVTVFYPSDYLKDGVRIIDTPGIGSIFDHNTDVTYRYLPNCDAAVFMLSPDPPITKSELEFLKDSKEFVHKFFFVLNKKDLLKDTELQDVVEFNKNVIAKELHQEIDMVCISALDAFWATKENNQERLKQSNINVIDNTIIETLKKEKDYILCDSIISSAVRKLDSIESEYILKKRANEMSLDDLKQKADEFREFFFVVEKQKGENRFILDGKTDTLIKTIDEHIESLKNKRLTTLVDKMIDIFKTASNKKIKTEELEDLLKNNMQAEIKTIFKKFKQDEVEFLSKEVESIYADFRDRTNATIRNITKKASSLFDMNLKPFEIGESFLEKQKFSFKFKDQEDALVIMSGFLRKKLPLFVGRIVVEKHIIKTTKEIFDRHCGRIRHYLVENIQETTRQFGYDLEQKIEETLSQIDSILNETLNIKSKNEKIISTMLFEINQKIEFTKDSKRKLGEIIKT